jgi:hypothetical protein
LALVDVVRTLDEHAWAPVYVQIELRAWDGFDAVDACGVLA